VRVETPATLPTADFTRQVQRLIETGYPAAADMTDTQFAAQLEPLRARADEFTQQTDGPRGFVLVVSSGLVPAAKAMSLIEIGGRRGYVGMDGARPLEEFAPIPGLDVPAAPAYLLVGVETGRDTCDVTPTDALRHILSRDRSPLTIDEGIAVLTQVPDVLTRHNAYSLLGSRAGDKRVPAIWLSLRAPRLGWCWAGNPHTWLGSASCARRVSA
jgi:hypothetical protein